MTECRTGIAAIVVGGAIVRRQRDGAVEVPRRLVGMAEIHDGVTAIVVDGGVLGRDLNREIEVVDGLGGALQPPFGDAAIAVGRSLDEVGDLRRGQHLVIGGDGLIVLSAEQRRRAFAGTEHGLVLGMGGSHAKDEDQEKPENFAAFSHEEGFDLQGAIFP